MCCNTLKFILSNVNDEHISHSTVAEENGKKITYTKLKSNEICKLRLDNCHFPSQKHKKCDFLFYICKTNEIHLVELKGTDVEHGCNQIAEAYSLITKDLNSKSTEIKEKFKIESMSFKGYIVSSAVPKATEIKFRKLQEKIMKEKKLLIKKSHNHCSI